MCIESLFFLIFKNILTKILSFDPASFIPQQHLRRFYFTEENVKDIKFPNMNVFSHEILDFFEAKFQENITLNIPQLSSKKYLKIKFKLQFFKNILN